MKPATPLPWHNDPTGDCGDSSIGRPEDDYFVAECIDSGISETRTEEQREQDSAYIVHACNAYPKLVEALQYFTKIPSRLSGEQLGKALALLKELGEAE